MPKFNMSLLISLLTLLACAHSNPPPKEDDGGVLIFEALNPPVVGQTVSGDQVMVGGLSGLWVTAATADEIHALSILDRGPNAKSKGKERPFAIPSFQPRIVKYTIDLRQKSVRWDGEILLKNGNRPLSGLPHPKGQKRAEMEKPVDLSGQPLNPDPQGVDTESLCVDRDGTFWVGEEYGPDLIHFSAEGNILKRYSPGNGLPTWLTRRKPNNGFEGIACTEGKIFAIIQAPLLNKEKTSTRVLRMIEFEPRTEKTIGTYVYELEDQDNKIGDMFAQSDDQLLVIEQNPKNQFQKIYSFSTKGASNLGLQEEPELLTGEELRQKLVPVAKREYLDLRKVGYNVEKAEGLAMVNGHLLVVSDNDFGLVDEADFKAAKVKVDPSVTTKFAYIRMHH